MNKFDGHTELLSPAQFFLWCRTWAKVQHANDWVLKQRRLSEEAVRETYSIYHAIVWRRARQYAAQHACGVGPDSLRRACIRVAIDHHHTQTGLAPWPEGEWPSSKTLDNARFDCLLCLSALLVNADDLDASMAWDSAERRHEKRLDGFLASREAAVRKISGNMFGSNLYEDLPLEQKEKIARMLRASHRGYRDVRRPIRTHASDDDDGLSVPGSLVDCARR